MHPTPLGAMPLLSRWRYALKPGSWPKLLVAAALGHAIGIAETGRVDPLALSLGALLVVFDLWFVVLVNDWGDQEVDSIKRRIAADLCSPKTIPDGILDATSVLLGGIGAAVLVLAVAVTAEVVLARPGIVAGAAACMLMFVLYTLPPVRLNYRGGGELLEMIGVGFALPWLSAYVQSGVAMPRGMVVLPGYALACLASALASGLADEDSDRLGGKRTFVTMFGASAVRQAVEGLVLGTALVWAVLPLLSRGFPPVWAVVPVALVMTVEIRELLLHARSSSDASDPTHAGFKARLHDCIWHGALVMAAMLALVGLLRGDGVGDGG